MGFFPFGAAGNGVLAATPAAGFPLQNNANVVILAWTAPADGKIHFVNLTAQMYVTAGPQVGGQVNLWFTEPLGNFQSRQMIAGSNAAGFAPQTTVNGFAVAPGQTVQVVQTVAQTAGTASLWAVLTGG